MSDFTRTVIKWIVVGLIFILIIVLLTNTLNKRQVSSNNPNKGQIVNDYEQGIKDDDDGLEPINDLDDLDDEDEPSREGDLYVNAPDTANKDWYLKLLGLVVTASGIIYIRKNEIKTIE